MQLLILIRSITQQCVVLFLLSKKGVGNMVNLQTKINKLMMALRNNGVMVKLNTQQYFSEKQGRVCTKLILFEEHPNRDGEVFYSKVELLKALAEKWKEVKYGETAENTGIE